MEFQQASYFLPRENWPKKPAWHINYWYPNEYYGKESEFVKENDDWYHYPDYPYCRIHKDCFKHKESCMAIASFEYDDGFYELRFVGDRPINLTKEERKIFWKLIRYGNTVLNKNKEIKIKKNEENEKRLLSWV